MKPSVIIFDVNETLLDMTSVKTKVNKALGSRRGFKLWFGLLLQYALVDTVTGNYHDFGVIAKATLEMAALTMQTEITEADTKDILDAMKKLPPHDDVKEGLRLLKDAGFRLATLTNSPPDTLTQQLDYAGLSAFFDAALSVSEFKKYKPHAEVYANALTKLGVHASQALLVAAHGWDIAGALSAGLQAGFIQRKGQSLYSLAAAPQYRGEDLTELAHAIVRK